MHAQLLLCQWFSRDVFYYYGAKRNPQQFAAIPSLIKNRKVPLWNCLPVSVERWWYFLKAHQPAHRGRNVSNRTDLRAIAVWFTFDRVGIGVDEKKYFTPYRIIVHYLRLLLRFLLCHRSGILPFHLTCHSSVLSWFACRMAARGNAKVAEATGSMLVSITWNSSLDFVF